MQSVAQTPKAGAGSLAGRGFAGPFNNDMDMILDDVDSRVDPHILKSLIGSKTSVIQESKERWIDSNRTVQSDRGISNSWTSF